VTLTKMQTLTLWALLANAGGASAVKNIKPAVRKPDREALVKAGLIAVEKRGRDFWLKITDEGWTWATAHLDAGLPMDFPGGGAILGGWLTQLKTFIQAHGLVLADVLGPQPLTKSPLKSQSKPRLTSRSKPQPKSQPESAPTSSSTSASLGYPDLRQDIRKAYLQLTNGRFNTRAHLSDIRKKLRSIDRGTLDEALVRMQREQEASLYQLDNRIEITDADRAAAIYVGREPRHILWIER
jgi:hypothetical protein